MIKKLLSVVLFTATVGVADTFAQANCTPNTSCVPNNVAFGICPDSTAGIPAGMVGVAYNVTMSIKIPGTQTGATVSQLALTDVLVDTSTSGTPVWVSITTIGLDYLGNGSNTLDPGSSGAPDFTMTKFCAWNAPGDACVIVSGTPTKTGTFPITIKSRARAGTFGIFFWTPTSGSTSVPDNTDYKLLVSGPSSVELLDMTKFNVAQNAPNPFNEKTEINFSSPSVNDVDFKVYNVVGAVVYSEKIKADKGANVITLKANAFAPGAYMYSITNGSQTITKRMQNFELTILGCSSATPTSSRNPTAQLLNIAERFFLIDCGEATQIQLRKYKIKFQKITHIFISHLHGDHYFGLMGLLSSMHLLGRTNELHLYCPPELQEIIEIQFKHSQTYLKYRIVYHPHRYIPNELLFEDNKVEVRAIVLNHRIPCCGFLFKEKPLLANISKETIKEYKIPVEQIMAIKTGSDLINSDGSIIPNKQLVSNQLQPRSYAYCSDTCYDERIIDIIKGSSLLYHEATFMNEMQDRAKETYHSTTIQAATIAQKAQVKQLMIGHYSARYKDLQPMLAESKSVFSNTLLAVEGESITVS